MPAKKDAEVTDATRQLACVIAIYCLREVPAEDAAIRLDQIGFSAKEIGGILGKNDNYVHMVKSAKNKKRKK